MSPIRLVAAVVLVGSALTAGVSSAAPKPVCGLVSDPAGDTVLEGQAHDDANLDVLGADVASDGKRITAVLRMGGVEALDPKAPFGRTVYFHFTSPGVKTPMYLSAHFDPATGMFYDFGAVIGTGYSTTNHSGTAAIGSVDAVKKTITISAPADLGKMLAPGKGRTLQSFQVRSTLLVGVARAGLVFDADLATSKTTYTTGAPSCVAVAKG